MGTGTVGGMSWVIWVGLAVVAVALVVVLRRRLRQVKHRQEAERMAIAADAHHEGARTRHEGGA